MRALNQVDQTLEFQLKNSLRTYLVALLTAVFAFVGLAPVSPANATVEWVAAPTWTNLHVKNEPGVFERARREFDTSSKLVTSSETQHNTAYIRLDRDNVTVQYIGGVANANKKVQFLLTGDMPFTDTAADPDNIMITDETGLAEVTLTLTEAALAEQSLQVSISSGEVGSETVVGNMAITWQPEGYYPIIKLVSTGKGFESRCTYRAEPDASGAVGHAHECLNGDLAEYTWEWSVFKKDWLPDYSQVYVKSYKYGSTIDLTYKVTDIWGTPIVGKQVHLTVDNGCRLCKWKDYESERDTDALGMVSFSVGNKNSFKDVKNNKFVNSDTKAKESGFIAFSIQPTTNELDESADFIWPQLVTDLDIKDGGSKLTTISRGGFSVNAAGDYVTTVDGQQVTNPALSLDTKDVSLTDIDVVNLAITYKKNSIPIALYSPEIRVEADNGGKAAIFDNARPLTDLASSASFSSPLVFSYTYIQRIALMCTKTGVTTFKIYTGKYFKTHEMSCKNSLSDARNIVAVEGTPAIPTVAGTSVFKVVDRWGSPVAGVTVRLSSTGNGTLETTTDQVTGEDGLVTANVSAETAGDQTVTATIIDEGSQTQVGEAADIENGIAAGNSTIDQTVAWGAPLVTVTPGKRKVTINFFNLSGLKATYLDGRKKSYINVTTANQISVKAVTKGKHTIKITVGSQTMTITVTFK